MELCRWHGKMETPIRGVVRGVVGKLEAEGELSMFGTVVDATENRTELLGVTENCRELPKLGWLACRRKVLLVRTVTFSMLLCSVSKDDSACNVREWLRCLGGGGDLDDGCREASCKRVAVKEAGLNHGMGAEVGCCCCCSN